MTTTTTLATTSTLATYGNINILNIGHCPVESSSETQDQAALAALAFQVEPPVPMLLVTQGTVSSRSGKWCYESEELFRSSESKGSKRQVRNGWFGDFVPWLQAGTSLLPTDRVRLKNEIRSWYCTFLSCWCPRVEFCAPWILGHNCQQLRELDVSKSRLNDVFKEQNITRKAVQLLLLKALGLGKTITEIDGSMKLVNGSLSSVVSWLIRWFDFRAPFFFAQFLGRAFVWVPVTFSGFPLGSLHFFDPGSSSLGILEAGKGSKRRSRWCTWRRGNCGCRRRFYRDFFVAQLASKQDGKWWEHGIPSHKISQVHCWAAKKLRIAFKVLLSFLEALWTLSWKHILLHSVSDLSLWKAILERHQVHRRPQPNMPFLSKGCAFSQPDKMDKFLERFLCFVGT